VITCDVPTRVDAEQAVLGAVMLDNRALARVSDWLTEGDFSRADHRAIYRAILALASAGKPFDQVTLAEGLEGEGDAEEAGGVRYILELASTTPSVANVVAYAEIVAEASRLRRALDIAAQLAADARAPAGRSAADVMANASALLSVLQSQTSRGGLQQIKRPMKVWWEELLRRHEGGHALTGLPTPWRAINDVTFGLQPGHLIVLGGRPGMGKSVLGFNLSAFTALRGNRVALFSLEMGESEVIERCVSALGEIPNTWLRSPAADRDADHWPKLSSTVPQLRDAPLLIDDQPALAVEQICSRARRAHLQSPLSLVVIDHMHIVKLTGKDTVRELGEVSRALKALAKELRIPVVALAQLNRANVARQDKRPTMGDLRASGEIEQDADLILLPHREDYYRADGEQKDHAIELVIGKGRSLPASSIWLRERFDIMRADDWEGSPPSAVSHRPRAGHGRDRAAGFDA
jgi:replicative DNA helicase